MNAEENNKPQETIQPENTAETPKEVKEDFKETREDTNVIFIGSKPIINYVRSISVQLNKTQNGEVIVRSRGKFISKAVDIVEIARRKFLEKEGVKIKDIKISSEPFEKEGRQTNVSTMDIILVK